MRGELAGKGRDPVIKFAYVLVWCGVDAQCFEQTQCYTRLKNDFPHVMFYLHSLERSCQIVTTFVDKEATVCSVLM